MRVIANLPRKAYKVGGLEVGAGGILPYLSESPQKIL